MAGSLWRRQELLIVGAVVAFDQLAKALVRANFELHDSLEMIPGFFNLTRVHNYGAAFGLLNSTDFPFKTVVLSTVAAVALSALAVYALKLPADQRFARFGLALIVGGAAGNLIDRIGAGYVVDFVDVYWGSWHFWAFNVADAAITVGVVFMILDLLNVRTSGVSRAN
jgi:signal peptidase II